MVIGWSLLIWPTVVYGKMWYWARAVGSWVTGSTMMDNFWDGMSNFISTVPGMLMMECWSIPVATYSEVNGTRVPTNPVYWVARRTFPLMVTDGAMERALMVAFPVREAMTGNPMSEANMISIGARSMDFWALTETEEPEPERDLDLMDSSRPSFSMTLDISEWMERLISDFSCSGVPAEDPETLVTTSASLSRMESVPERMKPVWATST